MDAKHRVLLTGTPLQNSLEELFYLMNFLEPLKFPNVEEFKAAYASLNDKDKVSAVTRVRALDCLSVFVCGSCLSPGHGRPERSFRACSFVLHAFPVLQRLEAADGN